MSTEAIFLNSKKFVGNIADLRIIDNCKAKYYYRPDENYISTFSKVGEGIDNFITHEYSTVTKSDITPLAIGVDKNDITWLFVHYLMNTDTHDLETETNCWVKLSDIKYKFGGVVKAFIYRVFSCLPSERKVA